MKVKFKNGSIIQIVGSDNYDAIMGTNPSGCIFSEYSIQDPNAWQYIRPILDANKGWAIFVFTPRGANHAKELFDMALDPKNKDTWFCQRLTLSDTKVITDEQLQKIRDEGVSEDMIQQEWYCSFTQGIVGSYYARYVQECRDDGRIGKVPWDEQTVVHTAWDLGVGDSTCIIWFQLIGKEIHAIDYYEASGEGLPHYAKILKDKAYLYGTHYAPHDIEARELSHGLSRREVASSLGIRYTVLPTLKLSKEEAIECVRGRFNRVWIDAEKCKRLILCLENYRKEWNDKMQCYKEKPVHDWASHGCFVGETLIKTHMGDIRIDELEVGDHVVTPNGLKRVKQIFQYESKDLRRIKTTSSSFICTSKHQIFSEKGLTNADTLNYNDAIFHEKDRAECHKRFGSNSGMLHTGFKDSFLLAKMKNRSYSMDIGLDGMDFTTGEQAQHQTHIPVYNELFMPIIKAQFQRDGMCIMSMEIPETMIYQILKSYLHRSIQKCIILKKSVKNLVNQFIKPWSMQKNGMQVQKDENGTKYMQVIKDLEKSMRLPDSQWFAKCVKIPSSEKYHSKNIALLSAALKKDIFQELMMKLVNVRYALRNILPISMQSRERVVENVPMNLESAQKVYDFEVEDDHCYYANGILVSNSDAFSYMMHAVKLSVDNQSIGISDSDAERMMDRYKPIF